MIFKVKFKNLYNIILPIGILFLFGFTLKSLHRPSIIDINMNYLTRRKIQDSYVHPSKSFNQSDMYNAIQAYQELFTLDIDNRRNYIANYLGIKNVGLNKPVVGDYITSKRLDTVKTELLHNGFHTNNSVMEVLSSASGLHIDTVENLLVIIQQGKNIDSFFQQYPNLASPEWEIFIQSQEINSIIRHFTD